MKIILNGKEKEVAAHTLSGIIAELGITESFIAAAKNGKIVPKAQWAEEKIADNDTIELFSPVGGG